MLIRMRVLPTCQIFLMAGLLLAAGESISAQSTGNAQSQALRAALPAEAPSGTSPNLQGPSEPGTTFEDVLRIVKKEGRMTTISRDLSQDLGLANTFDIDLPLVGAHALQDPYTHREIYVIDDTRDVLFRIKTDDTPLVYLANRAGVLQKAGEIKTGRFRSQSFHRIPMESAKAGFDAEKEFWIKRVSSMKDGTAVKSGRVISKPE
jgi:hypothetical protein